MIAIDRRRLKTTGWAAAAVLVLLPKCAACVLAWSAVGLELCGAPARSSWPDGWMLPLALSATATLLTLRCHKAGYDRRHLCSR
jgi:hypothetical protein